MKKQAGITFIELILIVSLILILATMTPVFYSRFILQNALANTTDQMAGSLRKAQLYSMMSKQGDSWSVNYSSNTITLYKGTSFTTRDTSLDEKFEVNPNVSVSGMTDLSFSRVTGLPTPVTSSITITSGGNSETITVNNQGVVSR